MKKEESPELANFKKPDRSDMGDLLADIFGSCACFSTDTEIQLETSDEKELQDYSQILLSKLQEEEENLSFFPESATFWILYYSR